MARRSRICRLVAGVTVGLAVTVVLTACGGSSPARGARGRFPVAVTAARFPAAQRLAAPARLLIAVRNAGARALPDVAVTICNGSCAADAPRGQGTDAAAFGYDVGAAPNLADPSRPLWIVNRAPGPCESSCRAGGPGAGVTASSNTWALGRLAPGHTARFAWGLTPVRAGRHTVAWEVAGDLSGAAHATLRGGRTPRGTFTVRVSARPARSHVNARGEVVSTAP